jgi:hypothetical protein
VPKPHSPHKAGPGGSRNRGCTGTTAMKHDRNRSIEEKRGRIQSNGNIHWLVVSNINFIFYNIWDVILPIGELIFFKMVIAPPTSKNQLI